MFNTLGRLYEDAASLDKIRAYYQKLLAQLKCFASAAIRPRLPTTLDDIRKEARTDDFLKRSDLVAIYQESARWSQAPRG